MRALLDKASVGVSTPRMRLFLITLLALIAFAANSVLTRSALSFEQIGAGAFAAIRLGSGAVMLFVLVALRGGAARVMRQGRFSSVAALLLYAVAFSYAYVTLDAGLGALILFGGVQITMFAGALLGGERPSVARWFGTVSGMAGLAILFAPGNATPEPFGVGLMLAAALGWGVYSLQGRKVRAPLEATAANFILAAPFAILLWILLPASFPASMNGVLLAVASGALASGLGYAIWYATLPSLDSSLAAVVQLLVPIIALGGGMAFLGEGASWIFAISTVLVLGGVLVAVLWPEPEKP